MMDLFLTNVYKILTDTLELWCGLLWCFYQLFGLSFWRHPFIAVDPLVSKRFNATFLQICSDEEQTNLYLCYPEGEYIFCQCSFLGELFL